MFNLLLAGMMARRAGPGGEPFAVQPASPLRQVSPCQVVTPVELQQIIMARTGPWIAALNAIPGVTATVEELRVVCPRNLVDIRFRVDFRLVNVMRSGTIRVFLVPEPVAFPSIAVPATSLTLCLRTGQPFFDLGTFPAVIEQQIRNVTGMIFSGRVCLPGAPPLRQSLG